MAQYPAKMDDAGPETAGRLALLICADEENHDLAVSWLTERGMSAISAAAVDDAPRQIVDRRVELLVPDTLLIYLPRLPSLRRLKEERLSLRVVHSLLALTNSLRRPDFRCGRGAASAFEQGKIAFGRCRIAGHRQSGRVKFKESQSADFRRGVEQCDT
jgi:hypothetical protein